MSIGQDQQLTIGFQDPERDISTLSSGQELFMSFGCIHVPVYTL